MKVVIKECLKRFELIRFVRIRCECNLVCAQQKVNNVENEPIIVNVLNSDLAYLDCICKYEKINEIENDMQNQFKFKPFDKVLVRTTNGVWKADSFSHINTSEYGSSYCCITGSWEECVPYNENTAHLLGTNKPYKEPEPKVWHVVNIKNGEPYEFTHNEFEHFIKTAVLNNKDITDFNARYVNN